MNKYILSIIAIFLLNGCSILWHNEGIRAHEDVVSCPAGHWPYIIDATLAVAAVTTATLVQTDTVHVDNPRHLDEAGVHIVALPLYMVGGIFTASAISGVGPVTRCHRIGEQ